MSGTCARPLDLATLLDYWFEDGDPAGRDGVEEHLIECDACSGRLRSWVALGEAVRHVAHQGLIQVVVTPSFLEAAAQGGLRIREYRVSAGARVECTVTTEDDLLVGRLQADFEGVKHLAVASSWDGGPEERVDDVPVSPAASELIMAQAMPAMRALGRSVMRVRLLAREEGAERLLGEYTFSHSPTRP